MHLTSYKMFHYP